MRNYLDLRRTVSGRYTELRNGIRGRARGVQCSAAGAMGSYTESAGVQGVRVKSGGRRRYAAGCRRVAHPQVRAARLAGRASQVEHPVGGAARGGRAGVQADPGDVGLLGAAAVVASADRGADPVEESRLRHSGGARFTAGERDEGAVR